MSARCPYCRDLFVPENGVLPTHFLDLWQGTVECLGSHAQPKDDAMERKLVIRPEIISGLVRHHQEVLRNAEDGSDAQRDAVMMLSDMVFGEQPVNTVNTREVRSWGGQHVRTILETTQAEIPSSPGFRHRESRW